MGEADWLFDSVMGFLRSPLWCGPLQTFIDENCFIFDGEEEGRFTHSECHENFRELVDSLLERHLAEMGVSSEQFVEACSEGTSRELNELVFQYILAIDDFTTFKRMMEKRNIELEYEALRQAQAHGSRISAAAPARGGASSSASAGAHGGDEEVSVLEAAIAASQAEIARMQREQDEAEKELLEIALQASLRDADFSDQQRKMEEAELQHAMAMSLALEEEKAKQAAAAIAAAAQKDQVITVVSVQDEKNRILKEHKENVEGMIQTLDEERERQEAVMREKLEQKRLKKLAKQAAADGNISSVSSSSAAPSISISADDAVAVTPDRKSASSSSTLPPLRSNLAASSSGSNGGALPPLRTPSAPPSQSTSPSHASLSASVSPISSVPNSARQPPSEAEVKMRMEYLKAQRDKLIQQKKVDREKEKSDYVSSLQSTPRVMENPSSSPAKHQASAPAAAAASENNSLSAAEQQRMQMRLALAKRFKEDMLKQQSAEDQ